MPKVWARSGKVYQRLWRRVGQAFCDGCGKVIRDDFYWKWQVTYIGNGHAWLTEEGLSHLNISCSGAVLLELMKSTPAEDEDEQNVCPNTEDEPFIKWAAL